MRSDNLYKVPADIPVPVDDGAARHLLNKKVPPVELSSTSGRSVSLSDPTDGLVVVYCYPRTGRPDEETIGGTANWNSIPGARGCTPQSCTYRDLHAELLRLGATVYGLSTQSTSYQLEAVQRLGLGFPLLSDANCEFADSLGLPVFEVAGIRLIKRITLMIRNGRIIHYFYPVFPPGEDAKNVAEWIRNQAR